MVQPESGQLTTGMINTSDPYAYSIMEKHFEGGDDWHLESRVDRFFDTSLQDFDPDFVQVDSGPWDFRVRLKIHCWGRY